MSISYSYRPVEKLKRAGIIDYTIVESDVEGNFDLKNFEQAIQPNTKLVVINHASNVIGVITPAAEMIAIAHKKGAKVLLDASQTAGLIDIDVTKLDVDYLAFTGHKALLGASGTGSLRQRSLLD